MFVYGFNFLPGVCLYFKFNLIINYIYRVWYKLFCKVKPLLAVGKEQEQLEEMNSKINKKKESLENEKKNCEKLEEEIKNINQETENLKKQLESLSVKGQKTVDQLDAITAANVIMKKIKLY